MANYQLDDCSELPNPELTDILVKSMFQSYIEIVKLRHPLFQIYFHEVLISYPSSAVKSAWLTAYEKSVDMREILVWQRLKSYDTYEDFFNKGKASGAGIWAGLFFTNDGGWHYWAAVLRNSRNGRRNVFIYEYDAQSSQNQDDRVRFKPSQTKLRTRRKSNVRSYCPADSSVDRSIHVAFDWVQMLK